MHKENLQTPLKEKLENFVELICYFDLGSDW